MTDYEKKMKEIKFRAWDKKYKKMHYPESYFETKKEWKKNHKNSIKLGYNYPSVQALLYGETIQGIVFGNNWGDEPDASNSCIIMQYIGLKDKNDKEIYEGDIVDVTRSYDERDIIWRVFIEDIRFLPEKMFGSAVCYYEIIGNVYENPEMKKNDR